MAETKIVELKVKSNIDDVVSSIDKLTNAITDSQKQTDKLTEGVEDVSKSVKETEKATKSLKAGFNTVGVAIKAMGIGLIIEAFSKLKDAFMGNQKVADSFGAIMGTISIVMNQVVNTFISVVEKVSKSTNGFDALGKVISGALMLALSILKGTFYGIGVAITEIQLGWENSFLGDKDQKTLKKLNDRLIEQKASLKDAGEQAVKSGKQIADNAGKAIGEVAQVVSGTIEGVSKISIKGAYEQAKANIQLQNTAKLAAAQQGRLVEQYDRQAEKLRQVRDNDLISIQDRIKSNNKLKDVLDKQEKAMIAQANLQIAAAQNTYNLNKNIENQVALTEALANKEGVLAQVEGLRSEQIANNISLTKEALDLDKSKVEGLNDLATQQAEFDADLQNNELKKLQIKRDNLEKEKAIELERLQFNINNTQAGTQARVDAELAYATKNQEINNAITANDKEQTDKRKEYAQAEAEAKLAIQNATLDNAMAGVGLLKGIFEKSKTMQKAALLAESAIGIAKIVISTQAANAAAKLKWAPIPGGQIPAAAEIIMNKISAGIGIAANIAGTAKGLSALGGGGGGGSSAGLLGGGGGGGGAEPTQAAPQFNVVGTSGANQIAQTLGNQAPVKAYVVSNDVTTAQGLDRNIVKTATLGG